MGEVKETEYRYDAFISYRHRTPDKPIAEKLQKLLETYTPPKGAVKDGMRKKLHLFRDETELPTSNDLGADIKKALEQSRFLVVICSPAFERSKWCMQEVAYFKALHGGSNRNILTLLADDPDKRPSFPEMLRFETRTETLPDGTVLETREEIEPLAANGSAKTPVQMLKRLKSEYLRIVAPLLGCGYDDLYQREQRQRNRRRLAVFGVAAMVLGLAAVLSTAAMLKISAQKREIEEKATALLLSNQEIEESAEALRISNREIEKNAAALRLSNQELLVRESEMLEKDGDLYGALEAAVRAFPEEGEPLNALIEQSVSLLGVYEPESFSAVKKIRLSTIPTDVCLLQGGRILAAETRGGLSLWDTETGAQIAERTGISSATMYRNPRLKEAHVIYYAKNLIRTINIGNTSLFTTHHKDMAEETPAGGENAVFVISQQDGAVSRISPEDGSTLWYAEIKGSLPFPFDSMISDEILPVSSYDELVLLDAATGEERARYDREELETLLGEDYTDVYCMDGYLIFAIYKNSSISCAVCRILQPMPEGLFRTDLFRGESLGETTFSVSGNTLCVAGLAYTGALDESTVFFKGYDLTNGELLWSAESQSFLPGDPFAGFIPSDKGANDFPVAFAVVGDRLLVADAEAGEVLFNEMLTGEAAQVRYSENGFVFFTDKNGLEYFTSLRDLKKDDGGQRELHLYLDRDFRSELANTSYCNNVYAIVRSGESDVILYRVLTNDARRTLYRQKGDESVFSDVMLSPDKSTAVVVIRKPDKLLVMDPETGDIRKTLDFSDETVSNVWFFGNDRLAVRLPDSVRILNLKTGETEQEFDDDTYKTKDIFVAQGLLLLERKEDKAWVQVKPGQAPAPAAMPEVPADCRWVSANILFAFPSCGRLLLKVTEYSDGTRDLLKIHDLNGGGEVVCEMPPAFEPSGKPDACVWRKEESELWLLWNDVVMGFSVADGGLLYEAEEPGVVDLLMIEDRPCVLDSIGYLIRMQEEQKTLIPQESIRLVSGHPGNGWMYAQGKNGRGYLYNDKQRDCVMLDPEAFEIVSRIEYCCGVDDERGVVYLKYYDCFDAYPLLDADALRALAQARIN